MTDRTSAKAIKRAERSRNALLMRKGGWSYSAIAEQLGFKSVQAAHKCVTSALTKMIEKPSAELRALEVARLDLMQSAIWEKAMKGDYGAIDRCLEISKRRSLLLGLNSPQKVALTDPSGEHPYEDARAELVRRLDSISINLSVPLPVGANSQALPSFPRRLPEHASPSAAGEQQEGREDFTGESGAIDVEVVPPGGEIVR